MADEAPEAWVGKHVQVAMFNDERFNGRIEAVNLYGITFQPTDSPEQVEDLPPKMLLPWPSVLWIVLTGS